MGANAQTSVPLYAAGEILTAANMNISAGTGVPVFATTTTRDAAFGGTGEKTLAEGQMCYIEAAPKRLQVYNGTAWLDYDAEWTTFTPTWSNYTRGNGTTDSRYVRVGKTVFCYAQETLGSTSSVSGSPGLTLPIAARSSATIWGSSSCVDAGFKSYLCSALAENSTSCNIYAVLSSGTYTENTPFSATVPFTWATNDFFRIGVTYEVA